MGAVSAVFLVLITILLPPVGVYIVAGCGADLLINICLTLLGYVFASLPSSRILDTEATPPLTLFLVNSYIPGHIHAFYLEYVYYERKESARQGRFTATRAPGVYSERVQSGGHGYGTMVQPVN
ncbi:Plasma membrane proteolipid [Lachnellula subtilissima]|uniref:Plasma membrane proteolipid n=1 Tax=Lachnellula subtilissima TaxID=602034 RepID=A0A8H8RU90_9HELO|nr:Plasma membrane proteolipid [Lachnellula subtilissima]